MTDNDAVSEPANPETTGYENDYSTDDEDQLQPADTLDDPDVADTLDRGYSPPEKYSPAQGFGNTPAEEAAGETLEQRIAQEVPEPDPYSEDDQDSFEADEPDDEVGDERAGRLVEPDEGAHQDDESGMIASDVGIDGAAASAEEAAIHVIPDDDEGTS